MKTHKLKSPADLDESSVALVAFLTAPSRTALNDLSAFGL